MPEGRRRASVLSLLLVVALVASAFVADAASAQHYSKAQRKAVSKKLMRAVKKNPRVVQKRWFLKKASQVDFTLPTTIRLLPAKNSTGSVRVPNIETKVTATSVSTSNPCVADGSTIPNGSVVFFGVGLSSMEARTITTAPTQGGTCGATEWKLSVNSPLSSAHVNQRVSTLPSGANTASLDLGPSLGSRTIGLGGYINAEINFNDAFDGGNLGDVRLKIAAGGDLKTTSVPLLTNHNTSTVQTGENTIDSFVLPPPASATGTIHVTWDGGTTYTDIPANSTNSALQTALQDQLTTSPTGTTPTKLGGGCNQDGTNNCSMKATTTGPSGPYTIGSNGAYAYVAPFANAAAVAANGESFDCPSVAAGCRLVTLAFVGPQFAGTETGPITKCTGVTCIGLADNANYVTNGFVPQLNFPPAHNVTGQPPSFDVNGDSGCGSYNGNGHGVGHDVDLLGNLTSSYDPGNDNNLGAGPYSPEPNAVAQDAVLRTGPLSVQVATPTSSAQIPGDSQASTTLASAVSAAATVLTVGDVNGFTAGDVITVIGTGTVDQPTILSVNPANSTITLTAAIGNAHAANDAVNDNGGVNNANIGPSVGKANLFGFAVNGLSNGHSVDTTVNLSTSINSIEREVDGSFPLPGGKGIESQGNIAAYDFCRQAWTGAIKNYLTNIHLVGSLRISPAVTADGHLRIARVRLKSQYPAGQALAACLSPYQLYMDGNPFVTSDISAIVDTPIPGLYRAPQLASGDPNLFNPISVLTGSAIGSFPGALMAPIPCDKPGGPLARQPFNVNPLETNFTSLQSLLGNGAAVAVRGDLSVTNFSAEVLVGNVAGG